jgi:large subunit ribosomal protein L9
LAKLDQRKKEMDKKKDEEAKIFNELIASVNNKKIILKVKANEKGHLFKSVSARDVKEAIKENSKIEIDEKTIIMDHIKELGVYSIFIKRGDKVGKCEVIVEAL